MSKFINFLSFQITWFVCIWGAANQHELLGVTIGLLGVAINLSISHCRKVDMHLILAGVPLGICVDTLLIHLQLITFKTEFWTFMSPIWMWVIWASLMTTLNSSMSWLKLHSFMSAILGAFMGPVSYYAGIRLGAGQFQHTFSSLAAISLIWFIVTPLLIALSNRNFDHFPKSQN